MKRKFSIFSVAFLIFCIFSRTMMFAKPLSPDSSLYYQDIPIYEGIGEFQEKLDYIRENEGREPLGLVLCGGSARAFSHIGVLKAMEEKGVVPDYIVANSMGAVIGMFYAYGFSPDEISRIVGEINLSSFFDPVLPLKGGFLSVRYFKTFVNSLLGKESSDISECVIPIIVLSEDLYTKRQIWHACGDFADVMAAAFAMTVFMEPVKYSLSDGTKVSLIDSGSIDIGGLKVAHHFSDNLIISTAFYDKKLNYNNPIVILNRTQSIGKERIAINDIKELKPVLIRNNVEKFSFMDFHKQKELTQAGYDSALDVMDEILVCPHDDSGVGKLSGIREKTSVLGENEIKRQQQDLPVHTQKSYFGAKIRPNFASLDFPNYFLYDAIGIGAVGFVDTPKFFARFGPGINFNSSDLTADLTFYLKPNDFIEASVFATYDFDMKNDFVPSKFYGATSFSAKNPGIRGDSGISGIFGALDFLDSVFVTAEWLESGFFETKKIFSTAGILIRPNEIVDEKVFAFKPYAFFSGTDFFSLNFGSGVDFQSQCCFGSVGFSGNFSGRYAFVNFDGESHPVTNLFAKDYFRAYSASFSSEVKTSRFLTSASAEIFYNNSDLGLTISEFIMCRQLQAGIFADGFLDDGVFRSENAFEKKINVCAGGFARLKASLVGLKEIVLETGCGWNFQKSGLFGYFTIKNPF